LQEWQESMLRRTVALSGILVSSRVFWPWKTVALTVTRSNNMYRRTAGSSQWELTYCCVCPVAHGVFCHVPLSVNSRVTTLELLAGISWIWFKAVLLKFVIIFYF
jgi:hypothetical protein